MYCIIYQLSTLHLSTLSTIKHATSKHHEKLCKLLLLKILIIIYKNHKRFNFKIILSLRANSNDSVNRF